MKIRKSTFKWLAWTLIFFLATAGLAQGAAHCKGKCCQGPQKPVVHGPEVLKLHLNLKTPLDAFLPTCHLSGPWDIQRGAVSEGAPCQNEKTPSCCHMGKAGSGVQALVSPGHSFGIDRLFHAIIVVCIQSDALISEDRSAVTGWTLHPRGAPVPLYLKNTSFIC